MGLLGDFAGIDAGHGEEELRNSFNIKVIDSVKNFLVNYEFKGEVMPENINTASIGGIVSHYLSRKSSIPVFVLIDEYDDFSNELITGGRPEHIMAYLHGEKVLLRFFIKP